MERMGALCVIGGDTQVIPIAWEKMSGKERIWTNARSGKETVRRGMCTRPMSCQLRGLCTGKVIFSPKGENGFTSAIIEDVVVVNKRAIAEFQR